MSDQPKNRLFQISDRINLHPRAKLAHLPTPVERWDRLSRWLGGPTIWAKRDDLTGLGLGGNKVRKLEFLLGEALHQGSDTVIGTGVVQSNHARQTAAAAAKLGLECHLVLATDRVARTVDDYGATGNIFLDRLFGASVETVAWDIDLGEVLMQRAADLAGRGCTPYIVPYGGSTAIGALGYALFMVELMGQLDHEIDGIVVASGSGGTQGGMLAAAGSIAPDLPVIGIDVDAEPDRVAADVARLAAATAELLNTEPSRTEVVGGFAGPGYGEVTAEMVEAVTMTARLEGVALDPVYSGKGMAGLFGLIRGGRFEPNDDVVFVHTGGSPGLFAYRSAFSGA